MTYTWHQVSEQEKEEIKEKAKKLLDEFSSKLSKIKTSEPKPETNENLRTENSGWKTDKEFRELMIDNAPMTDDGLIIAEKGGWK
jgi:Asp-tRNA(Asn)/Glu-tRNA(Gln) amidotransferase C subunit